MLKVGAHATLVAVAEHLGSVLELSISLGVNT
jgi:hypothetical protein